MNLRTWEDQRGRVSTASGEVSYTDVGEGPVALFVHGAEATLAMISVLQQGHRLVVTEAC